MYAWLQWDKEFVWIESDALQQLVYEQNECCAFNALLSTRLSSFRFNFSFRVVIPRSCRYLHYFFTASCRKFRLFITARTHASTYIPTFDRNYVGSSDLVDWFRGTNTYLKGYRMRTTIRRTAFSFNEIALILEIVELLLEVWKLYWFYNATVFLRSLQSAFIQYTDSLYGRRGECGCKQIDENTSIRVMINEYVYNYFGRYN